MTDEVPLPSTGTPVMLRGAADELYGSRIEGYDRDLITVVKPTGISAAHPPPPHAPFEVLWTAPDGLYALPVTLAGHRADQHVLLWNLRVAGMPWRQQRRAYVRVPTFGRITVTRALGDGTPEPAIEPAQWHGHLIDISEAALQCSITVPDGAAELPDGTPLIAEFTFNGEAFCVVGMVYLQRRTGSGSEMLVVIRFETTEAQAQALRRQVFAIQVDMRRLQRDTADGGPVEPVLVPMPDEPEPAPVVPAPGQPEPAEPEYRPLDRRL